MSSPGSTSPIDIPKSRANMSATMRNRGLHTADFIDPNLMQINPVPAGLPQGANKVSGTGKGKAKANADQAMSSMLPPPIPSFLSTSTSAAHSSTTTSEDPTLFPPGPAYNYEDPSKPIYHSMDPRNYEQPSKPDSVPQRRSVITSDLSHMEKIMRYGSWSRTPSLEEDMKRRPHAYMTPFRPVKYNDGKEIGHPVYAFDKNDQLTVAYRRDLSPVVEDEEGDGGSDDEWVDLAMTGSGRGRDAVGAVSASVSVSASASGPASTSGVIVKKKGDEDLTLDSEWIRIENENKTKRNAAAGRRRGRGRSGDGLSIDPSAGLAFSFYAGRKPAEKKLIEEEAKKMGWISGDE